jgi:hypothetical protein
LRPAAGGPPRQRRKLAQGGDIDDTDCFYNCGEDWEKETMRAIGLVLLSIAIMALLLTEADAKRRSSAQGARRRQ